MKPIRILALSLLLAVAAPRRAAGCPVCDTPAGREVRSGIFNAEFPSRLFELTSPYLVLGALVYGLHRRERRRGLPGERS